MRHRSHRSITIVRVRLSRPCAPSLRAQWLHRRRRRRSLVRRAVADDRGLDGPPRLGHLQAESRRRRHGVLRRRRPAVVPARRAAARRPASTRSPPTSRTRSSPSRITASTCIPGIDPIGLTRAVVLQPPIRRRHAGRQHHHAAAGAHAVPVQHAAPTAARCKEAALAVMLEVFLSKREILAALPESRLS